MTQADLNKPADELMFELTILRERVSLLEAVIESIDDAVYVKDARGRYQMMNSAGARLVGRSVEEVIGKDDAELFAPDTAARIMATDRQIVATGVKERSEVNATAAGTTRCYLSTKGPRLDAHGNVIGILGISRDVTERKRAERELARQTETLRAIFDHIPVMIHFGDPDGRVRLVNRHWEEVLGWSFEETRRVDIFAECYPDPEYRQRVLDCARNAPPGWHDFETRIRDGRVIQTSWSARSLSDGTRIWFGLDVTDRKRAERELRSLARRLVRVQEEERRHLARELHDQLGQALTAVKVNLQLIANSTGAEAESRLQDCLETVQQTIEETRGVALDLRPSVLDDFGLGVALRWLLDRHALRAGFHGRFSGPSPEPALSPDVATACFRIAQEALTNAMRHAKARNVAIALEHHDGQVVLTIRDDGVGFDMGEVAGRSVQRPSLGLVGMRERAEVLGGRMAIESKPGAGTTVRIRVPTNPPSGSAE